MKRLKEKALLPQPCAEFAVILQNPPLPRGQGSGIALQLLQASYAPGVSVKNSPFSAGSTYEAGKKRRCDAFALYGVRGFIERGDKVDAACAGLRGVEQSLLCSAAAKRRRMAAAGRILKNKIFLRRQGKRRFLRAAYSST